jgi:chromosome segregation ATPase
MRLEAIEAEHSETQTLQSRSLAQLSRIDQEIQRLSGAIGALEREDEVGHERNASAMEMLRRLETQIESLEAQANHISRLDDRLELVQAERTRHNERLNEHAADMAKIDSRLNEHSERLSLVEVRMNSSQDDMRKLKELLQQDREQLTAYLHSLSELEADMRKREIIALEKEIRDIRGRALHFAEE